MSLIAEMRKQNNFNEKEISIIEFLFTNYEKLASMTSKEVGNYTFTSSSSIVRLCQKLGCKGYSEFKVKFLSEMKYAEEIRGGENLSLSEEDSVKSVLKKVTFVQKQTLEDTKSYISSDKIMKITSLLSEAEYIDFFAYDLNMYIAQYACNQFFHCGKISNVCSAGNEQQLLALTAKENHVGIFISRNGENLKLIDTAKILRKSNVKTIAITMNEKSTLVSLCDEYIHAIHNEKIEYFGSIVFSTSVKYIIDILYSMLFVNQYKELMNLNNEYDVYGKKFIYDR